MLRVAGRRVGADPRPGLLPSAAALGFVAAHPGSHLRHLSVSEQTLQAPPIREPVIPERARAPRRIAPLELVRDHPWVSGTIGLLLLSTLIVVWARVRPGYDPYGWLV